MYASDAHQAALRALATRAAWIVEPVEGEVACGEQGQGKLADIQRIADAVQVVAERSRALAGKRVLVTSGPTREPLDDVRFLTNRSSGKMGAALARAALLMGAEVTVVTGPTDVPLPLEAEVLRVETAEQMLKVALAALPGASLVVGAAAVADYRPSERVSGKMRRSDTDLSLNLTPNPDVIASLAKAADPGCKVVAFAAEPDAGLETAQAKLARKGVGAVAVNDVSAPGIGFDADENELTLVTADGQERSGRLPKLACALWLLERVSRP
jgi:phosphopantothenoylcysteine decarboxylase / phosphopantothenate---cysteine ligase